jgi:hypothetical protein
MRRAEAVAWVVTVCAGSLRLSQAKTLGILVAAALRVERVSLANIGRAAAGSAKHQIKRCWRFVAGQSPIPAPCANGRVETADAMRGIVRKVLRKRKRPLLVGLDWTDVRQFQTLMAAAVLKGRSVPPCRASCKKHVYDGRRSRNAFEESLLLVLRSMVPAGQKVAIPADRGFGRTELARFCQGHGFDYVIRTNPDVHVHVHARCASFTGKLPDYPVHKGGCKLLSSVACRQHNSVTRNIVVRWVRNLPAKRDRRRNRRLPADECRFLMSSLSGGPARISRLYGQRMTIEELFRDQKNKRNGWGLRDTKITRAGRLDRLLLVPAVACLLPCGLGLIALGTCKPGDWTASSKNDSSIFTIGRLMLQRFKSSATQAMQAFITATEDAVPKWG